MAKKKQPAGQVRPVAPKPALTPSATQTRPVRSAEAVRTPPRPTSPKPQVASAAPELPIAVRAVTWWPSIVLALLGFALYINTFGHGYVLDDIAAISQNLFVKKGIAGIPDLLRTEFWHFSNISLGYYRPLSLITFALEQEYFKDSPNISHIINAVLYALTGLVIGVLLQKWLPKQTITAFLIGLVFIAHPIHTEIVANIKGRDELLSFLFISLMLLAHWRYLETKHWGWIFAACVSLYMAFLSKESSIVSLGLIPAMQYWFARRSVWQSLASLWPFLIVAALFFYQKKLMIGTLSGKPPVDWANYPYAIEKTEKSTTFKFFMYYIRLLFLPHPLVYDYSYNVIPSGGKGDMLSWAGFFSLVALAWLTIKGFIRRTLWGFGLFWFFVTMAPGLGFILFRGGILAERFLYAAVMGFGFVVIWGLQKLLVRDRPQTADVATADAAATGSQRSMLVQYAPLLALMAVVTGLYSFKTVDRNKDWVSNFVLFNSALPYAPNSCQVQRHVANEWIEKGLKSRVQIDTLQRRLQTKRIPADSVATAQVNIQFEDKEANRYGRLALNHLQQSTQIYPNFGEAYFSMAYVFQKIIPNVDSAKYYYKQTIRAASAYAPAYNNLGVIYQNEGLMQNDRRKLELASYYYNQSMIVNPAYQDGRNNWANLNRSFGLDVRALPDSILRKY